MSKGKSPKTPQEKLEHEIKRINKVNDREPNLYKVIYDPADYPEVKLLQTTIKVLDTYNNLRFLLEKFDTKIRFNMMSRRREITIPSMEFFSDDRENDGLSKIEALAALNGMPTRNIDKWLEVIASENAYHPIVDLLNNNPWDGISRLDNFLSTLKIKNLENEKFSKHLIRTFMISAIKAAHSKGDFVSHGVLVIQGPQGIGKTAWVKKLDPNDCGAIKTGALLDPADKDSKIGISRFWIAELGELDATLNKTDIARLKSYITSPIDDIRVPWGRKETRLVRRTAFIATVNDSNFLVDPTGNRRWWTVSVESINYDHNIDMIQLWAEVNYLCKQGERSYLTIEEQKELNLINEEHEKIDPFKEKLLSRFDWTNPLRKPMTACAVLNILGYDKPSPNEVKRMAQILQQQNVKPAHKDRKGNKVHDVPITFNTEINY